MKSKLQFILAGAAFFLTGLSAYLLITRHRAFSSGLNAGLAEAAQGQAASSYMGLELLDKVHDKNAEIYKKTLISNMNSSLYSLSFFDHEVKVRPMYWKVLVRLNEPTYKKFFQKLRDQRKVHNWLSNDPNIENKIQQVIERYILYGNPYAM